MNSLEGPESTVCDAERTGEKSIYVNGGHSEYGPITKKLEWQIGFKLINYTHKFASKKPGTHL